MEALGKKLNDSQRTVFEHAQALEAAHAQELLLRGHIEERELRVNDERARVGAIEDERDQALAQVVELKIDKAELVAK